MHEPRFEEIVSHLVGSVDDIYTFDLSISTYLQKRMELRMKSISPISTVVNLKSRRRTKSG
jgi:hypothetical protein